MIMPEKKVYFVIRRLKNLLNIKWSFMLFNESVNPALAGIPRVSVGIPPRRTRTPSERKGT